MRLTVPLTLVAGLLATTTVAADCVYDQSEQFRVLGDFAKQEASGVMNPFERTATWVDMDGTQFTVQYGGCNDFGFAVTTRQTAANPSPDDKLLHYAHILAKRFWDSSDAAELARAIAASEFTTERTGSTVIFRMTHQIYSQFDVLREIDGPDEVVTIRWLRDF